MNRKVLVAAVAATFAAPAAFAQSSVTIGGTVNILWDNVRANGGTIAAQQNAAGAQTVASGNMKSADRVRDGAGSNIRFTVIEDLGGGNSAFVQVESAVIMNSDQRADAVGNNQGVGAAGNSTAVWGNRNSGIGIRSKTAGRFLIGVWDVHYHEHYSVDPGWLVANSANSTLALTQNMGGMFGPGGQAFGTRYSNVLRWDSPVWSGFSLSIAYARPTDGVPPLSAGSVRDGKINRVWNIAPRYESGGLTVQYSYLQDKDGNGLLAGAPTGLTMGVLPGNPALVGAGAGATSTGVFKITSSRLGGRYKFANGFGVGLLWDQGKIQANQEAGISSSSVKRDVWALPLTFDTGNHHVYGTYGRAADWKGNIQGVSVTSITATTNAAQGSQVYNFGSNTGAKYWTLGYAYNLSQRTNVSVSYMQIKNDPMARYDGFANTFGTGAGNVGADPRSIAVGLRHTW